MSCIYIYIHYTVSVVMANSFFGRSTPLRIHSVYTYGRPYA